MAREDARITMSRLNVNDAQCAALFVSRLQRSDDPTGDAVAEAVGRTMRQFGASGCVGLMAQEFGEHPEAAMDRMQWIRQRPAPADYPYGELGVEQRARTLPGSG
jgi:hypothetical protein